MTDTETPIEAGARALHDRTYAGLDVGLWDRRTEVGRERFLGDARVVFGSVGFEDLVSLIAVHESWSSSGIDLTSISCSCGAHLGTYATALPAAHVHLAHLAHSIKSWLMGGGA
jgi:hypothetical protein